MLFFIIFENNNYRLFMLGNIQLEKIFDLLKFNPEDPLIFSTSLFFFLLCGFLFLYNLLAKHKNAKMMLIILFSLYFYYRSAGYLAGILIISAVVNFLFGKFIHETRQSGLRRLYLILAIAVNIGILAYFKYTNFVIQIINDIQHSQIEPLNIFLPIGISFYTFKALSYIFDIYMEMMEPTRSFRNFCVFVFFFPNIQLGPIERAANFLPQVENDYELTKGDMGKALFLICMGLIKTVIISQYLGSNFVEQVFDWPERYTGFQNLLATYGYSLQLYCDFSGYSDLAIGIALLMGFKLMDNFNAPFKATSIANFWRRWHISLSQWLLDYLFKPVQIYFRSYTLWYKLLLFCIGTLLYSISWNYLFGISTIIALPPVLIFLLIFLPKKHVTNCLGLIITFFICGLWHGSGWNFVIWGALHGFYMSVGVVLQKPKAGLYKKLRIQDTLFLKIIQGIITFHLIAFSFLIFRFSDLAKVKAVLQQIFTYFHGEIYLQFLEKLPLISAIMVLGFLFHFTPAKAEEKLKTIIGNMPLAGKVILLSVVIYIIAQFKSANPLFPTYFQY